MINEPHSRRVDRSLAIASLILAASCGPDTGDGAPDGLGATGGALAGGTSGASGGPSGGGSGGYSATGTGGQASGGVTHAAGGAPGTAGGSSAAGGAALSAGGESSGGALSTAGGAGAGGSRAGGAYPCNGDTSGYDAVVSRNGANWMARRAGAPVYTGGDLRAAIQASVDSLTPGRTSKESVLVEGDGTIDAGTRVSIPSYTVLNVCGTIDVTGSGTGDMAPLYARGRTDIEIPNVTITGSPLYALFFRDVESLHLGRIELRVSGGLGIRIDNHGRADRSLKVRNIRMDEVHAQGTGSHAVETYGVDGLTVGSVVARDVGECGLLLNDTVNAEVGLVDATGAGTGTGYAAFRMANRAGRIGDAYPTNVHVGQVIARGGGRGIFCVSESGGVTIDTIDIADTGGDSILVENCHNVTLAALSGTVSRGGDIRIAARTEFANTSDITFSNLTVTDGALVERPCAVGSTFSNLTLVGTSSDVCD